MQEGGEKWERWGLKGGVIGEGRGAVIAKENSSCKGERQELGRGREGKKRGEGGDEGRVRWGVC